MRAWSRHRYTVDVAVQSRLHEGVDEHGNAKVVYGPEHVVTGVVYAPSDSIESDGARRDHINSAATLYCPPGTKMDAHARVTTPDRLVWEVDGTPKEWPVNPFTGSEGGVVVKLLRGEG